MKRQARGRCGAQKQLFSGAVVENAGVACPADSKYGSGATLRSTGGPLRVDSTVLVAAQAVSTDCAQMLHCARQKAPKQRHSPILLNDRLTPKTPHRIGAVQVVFEPLDFIARMSAPVGKPRINLNRSHGMLTTTGKRPVQVKPAAPAGEFGKISRRSGLPARRAAKH